MLSVFSLDVKEGEVRSEPVHPVSANNEREQETTGVSTETELSEGNVRAGPKLIPSAHLVHLFCGLHYCVLY